MSEYAFWAMNNKFLDFLVILGPTLLLGIITAILSFSNFKYTIQATFLSGLLMGGTMVFTITNKSIMKMAEQKTGIHFTMREDNQFYINYTTTEKKILLDMT